MRTYIDEDFDEALEQEISATMVDKDIDGRMMTVFIDLVANIVTKCE